jgi:hypothetical protein|tara:strand:+ start:6502 stop:6693 length:192 start_codon:yes stop_codon:yes gene_type:complete
MLWEEIQNNLQKEIDILKNSLASGSASDYHSYMNTVGRISGLEWAKVEIKNLVNKVIYEEDEE